MCVRVLYADFHQPANYFAKEGAFGNSELNQLHLIFIVFHICSSVLFVCRMFRSSRVFSCANKNELVTKTAHCLCAISR